MISKERIVSSILITTLATFGILNRWGFIVIFLLLTGIALHEFFCLVKKKGIPVSRYIGILFGLAIPISLFFDINLNGGWVSFSIVFIIFMTFLLQFIKNETKNAFLGIALTLFGVFYVSWFFSYLIKLRFMPDVEGMKLVGFLLIVTKMTDIGALIVGKYLGRTPLMRKVSPNKTMEGFFGGLVFSMMGAVLFRSFLPTSIHFSFLHVLLLGLAIGGVGVLGDLAESIIKRDCQVKDSGDFLPAFGGVLDMIDSILFTAPLFYFYISTLLRFG